MNYNELINKIFYDVNQMCGIWAFLGNQNVDIAELEKYFNKMKHRGPDYSTIKQMGKYSYLGFHRLAIMDISSNGNQPFEISPTISYVCNGEIYGHMKIREMYSDYPYNSGSDCESLAPLILNDNLDYSLFGSEFAFICIKNETLIAARDPIGVRPLYIGINETSICLSSEIKGIPKFDFEIMEFPPGHHLFYSTESGMTLTRYHNIIQLPIYDSLNIAQLKVKDLLIKSVTDRLMSDVPMGLLLSGGLDSSLVAAISLTHSNTIRDVFTICFNEGSTDLIAAKKIFKYWKDNNMISSNVQHHIIELDFEDGLNEIDDVIYYVETYDITTVRASVLQKLISKHISKNYPHIRVILCGDNADECMGGYLYNHSAKNIQEFQEDRVKRVNEVHMYDGRRADRCMSAHSIEIRLPYADVQFVDYVMNLPSKYFIPKNENWESIIEKKFIRDAFADSKLLPYDMLYRRKEAMSDGCSTTEKSWHNIVKGYFKDVEMKTYEHCPPISNESMYYRNKFEEYFGEDAAKVIPGYWMPSFITATDPSARTLEVYK